MSFQLMMVASDMMGDMSGMGDTGTPVSTILKYIAFTLLGGIVLGIIGGKIYASFKYPDPNKRSVLSNKMKLILSGVMVVAIGLIVFALTFKPAPKVDDSLPVDGEMGTSDSLPEDGEGATDDMLLPEDATGTDETDPEGDEEQSEPEGEGDTESDTDTSSEESSSGGSTAAQGGGVIIGGGGNTAIAMPNPTVRIF